MLELLPQRRFQQLASRGMGQAGDKDELIRQLPLSELADQKRMQFLRGDLATFLEDDNRERSFLPLGMGGGDHRCLHHRRVGDKSILHVHGADPFPSGLDQILGAVGDLHIALDIDGDDIAGAEPAVVCPAVAFFG